MKVVVRYKLQTRYGLLPNQTWKCRSMIRRSNLIDLLVWFLFMVAIHTFGCMSVLIIFFHDSDVRAEFAWTTPATVEKGASVVCIALTNFPYVTSIFYLSPGMNVTLVSDLENDCRSARFPLFILPLYRMPAESSNLAGNRIKLFWNVLIGSFVSFSRIRSVSDITGYRPSSEWGTISGYAI